MAGKLIFLPFRVWLGSARLLTRAATGAAERAVSLAGHTIGVVSPQRSGNGRSTEWPQTPSAPAGPDPGWREESIEEPVTPVDVEPPPDEVEPPRQPAQPTPAPRTAKPSPAVTTPPPRAAEPSPAIAPLNQEPDAPAAVQSPEAPPVEEPVHVSEEPVLVREEAEPGAEDGAGAQLRVLEPWNGYARMNAREVIARAQQASAAELAAVRLYESRHRSRQTVLAAVDRQLKLGGSGNPA